MKLCGNCIAWEAGSRCFIKGGHAPYNRIGCPEWGTPLPEPEIETEDEPVKHAKKETSAAMRQAVLDAHEGGKKSINHVAKTVGVSWDKAKEIIEEAQVDATPKLDLAPVEAPAESQPTLIDERSEIETEAVPSDNEEAWGWADRVAAALDELDPRQAILHRLEESQKALTLIDDVRKSYGRVPEIEAAINAHYCKRIGGA